MADPRAGARPSHQGMRYVGRGRPVPLTGPFGDAPSNPVVQTSNRRFRDDEFLVPRRLTEGRSRIRVRVEFTPVGIPLLPDRPVPDEKWSEIRYNAYSYVMPAFSVRAPGP